MMPIYRNDHGGTIVLPDGAEVANGEAVDISEDMAKASGVASLIDAGGLILDDAAPKKSKKRSALEAQAEAASITHDGLSDDDLIAAIKATKA